MIEIIEQIIGITYGTTSYDDIIVSGSLILGMTSILVIIQIFRSLLKR